MCVVARTYLDTSSNLAIFEQRVVTNTHRSTMETVVKTLNPSLRFW